LVASNAMGDGISRTLEEVIRQTGVYYVRVWGYDGAAAGSFDLSAIGIDGDIDSDTDGLSDAAEYWHGTDPGNPDSNGNTVSDAIDLKGGVSPKIVKEFSVDECKLAKDPASSLTVPYLNSVFRGHPSGVGETWYKFSVNAGSGYAVVLTSLAQSGWLNYGIYDATKTKLIADSSSMGDGETQVLDKVIEQSGTYYVKVWGYDATTAGAYDLAIYDAWFNADVSDSTRAATSFYSSFNTARYLADGNYPVPLVSYKEQLFRFTAKRDVKVFVTMVARMSSGYINFGIYDVNGNQLVASNAMGDGISPVSYTHLTLPTIYSV